MTSAGGKHTEREPDVIPNEGPHTLPRALEENKSTPTA